VSKVFRIIEVVIIVFLLLIPLACDNGSRQEIIVTGKTVYKGMGIEGANVLASQKGVFSYETKSTYHGTFKFNLPPGEYTLTGSAKSLVAGEDEIELRGELPCVVVLKGQGRLDQLVVELKR
jgi:hypothetical protein